jgi:hypothetical protein
MHPKPRPGQVIKAKPREKKAAQELMVLAHDYAVINGMLPDLVRKQEITDQRAEDVATAIQGLDPDDARAFNSLLAMYVFGSHDGDLASVIAASR